MIFLLKVVFCFAALSENKVWWGYEDDNWDAAGNWAAEGSPTLADQVFIDHRPAGTYTYPVLTDLNADAKCAVLKLSQYGSGGRLDITGGKLSVGNLAYIGIGASFACELNISCGELIVANNMFVPYGGETTVTMTGGNVSIGGSLSMMNQTIADGFINLLGGTIEAAALSWPAGIARFGHINIEEGALKINSAADYTAQLQALIDSGDITAYGSGTTRYDWISHPRAAFEIEYKGTSTILTAAIEDVNKAWNPSPADGGSVDTTGENVILTWSPGENTLLADGHDIYLGASFDDVNQAGRAEPEFKSNQTDTGYIPCPQLKANTTYYWRVDQITSSGIVKGNVWSFTTNSLIEDGLYTSAFGYDLNSNIVSTSVFSWYSSSGGQVSGPWLPLEGRENWTGDVLWWKSQIKQMMAANIDVLYVHLIMEHSWHDQNRINLFQALNELRKEGYDVPKVAPFLDPLITWDGAARPYPNLATTAGKDEFAAQYIRFFNQYYSVNEDAYADDYIARIDGRVVLDTWHVHLSTVNTASLTRQDLAQRLSAEFAAEHAIFSSGIYMVGTDGCALSFEDEQVVQFQQHAYFDTTDYNGIRTVQVKGGYWDQNIREPGYWLARSGGTHYKNAWNLVNADSAISRVYIESWNEYDEGSGIYAADCVNSPDLFDGRYYTPGSENDIWSESNDPYEYIKTTAAGAGIFNDTDNYNARILWHNIPDKIRAGEMLTANIIVQNSGDFSWTAANNYKLGQKITEPSEVLFGSNRYLIDDNSDEIGVYAEIFRGRPVIFELQIAAPQQSGVYTAHWQMLREGVLWFGEQLSIDIEVLAKSDLNYDGVVNGGDFKIIADSWLSRQCCPDDISNFDINEDDKINLLDFSVLAQDWLN
ncbi:dockerin type I domain-containing protein [Limihaloglobus sulfuriphilus]|uniref:dockerin type I domain-containing protein n=1 Tax=Limihaloglobus sulfuriphilus TaxID=1851148 RepID=UPI001649C203|nr:dockerin type I domain-containing protein [Limihaloglobus sulfuriphilus]